METRTERPKLMVSIVERRRGKDMIRLYDREGVSFHYQTVGRGIATSEIMDILGLESRDKDIVLSFAPASLIDQLVYRMSNELRGSVDTKGIFFDLPLTGMSNMIAAALSLPIGDKAKREPTPKITDTLLERKFKTESHDTGKERPNMSSENKHSLILISVNQGYTETVLDTARKLGARGGTILRARWSGVKALEKYHGISLQTEKEIMVIIVPNELRNRIMDAVNEKHGLKTEAQAIVCSMNVDHFAPI